MMYRTWWRPHWVFRQDELAHGMIGSNSHNFYAFFDELTSYEAIIDDRLRFSTLSSNFPFSTMLQKINHISTSIRVFRRMAFLSDSPASFQDELLPENSGLIGWAALVHGLGL
ncbi:MAG TPA: hypothetical protein DEG72_09770, partial [Hyphomonas sp.]|nr:hypothetical protein [Hyphomonas sp.]